jgi:uncharacterized membrane protein YfcA
VLLLSIFIAALLAFSISLICGGGAGLLLIPILGYVLPAAQVPAALTIGTSISAISKIWLFYQNIRWPLVRLFLPAAIPGVVLGAWLLSYLNPMYIELCMAIFLVSNLPYVFKKTSSTEQRSLLPSWVIRIVGLLAGLISGLTGAVGVLFNHVYFRCGLNKEEIVATRAANEIILHIIKLFLYVWLGLFTVNVLKLGLVVAIAAVLATIIMKVVLPRISLNIFSKFGYSAMVIAGLLMLNSAVMRIQEAHNPNIEITRVAKGFDAAFSWNDLLYTIEFKYGEGFEFESIIAFTDLPIPKQAYVLNNQADAKKIVIEKVYSLKETSYEAYYYDSNDQLVRKIKFH